MKCKTCERQAKVRGYCHTCYHREIYRPAHRQEEIERKRLYRQKNKARLNKRFRDYYHNGHSTTLNIANNYIRCGNGQRIHRLIAEKVLGRKLKRNECVHHIDGNGLNNQHSNLIICTLGYHMQLHARQRKQNADI